MVALVLSCVTSAGAQPQVYHIPSLQPGGAGVSNVLGISANGIFVVGAASSPNTANAEAYRWSVAGGIQGLGDLNGGQFNSFATKVSADGSVVTGLGEPGGNNSAAFRWTQATGITRLNTPPGMLGGGIGYAVSGDGAIITGSSGNKACFWNIGAGQAIPPVNAASSFSEARAISNDGNIIAGAEGSAFDNARAFMWTAHGGTVLLPDVPNGTGNTIATGISGDGHVILGASRSGSSASPIVWRDGISLALAPGLPGTAADSTFDGSIIVGGGFGSSGFIWDATRGYRNINQAMLGDYGLVVEFGSVAGISDDGRVIAGQDPGGRGLVVVLPEPSSIGASAIVCAYLLHRRRRTGARRRYEIH